MKEKIIPVLNHNKFDFTEMYGNDAAIYLKESIITEPIVFNQEAKVIFSCINGTNTIDDISEILRKKYKIGTRLSHQTPVNNGFSLVVPII